jgi:uncharacterized OB-fold protein
VAEAQIILPRCQDCGAVQYPPREVCRRCLGASIAPAEVDARGELLSWTALHVSHEPALRDHLPWRIGLVKLGDGVVLYAHLCMAEPRAGAPVSLHTGRDLHGRDVFVAVEPGGLERARTALRPLIEFS